MNIELLELAKTTEFNEKAEAQAVYDYTEMLKQIANSGLDETDKDEIAAVITEIVADELNHQHKLHELYTQLTGIVANAN